MTQTYELKCRKCGKSYRCDSRRGLAITKILVTDPNYLANYECQSCKKGISKITTMNPTLPTPPTKKERKKRVKTPVEEPETPILAPVVEPITITFGQNVQEWIPSESKKYHNRQIGGVLDYDIIRWHHQHEDPEFKNVLFIGQTGTGKSLCIHSYCAQHKIPYYRVVMNAGTTTEDIVGQLLMDKDGKFTFTYQVLVKFMQEGGIFVFDEINAGQKDILHILNGICDWERRISVTQHKGEVIKANPNFLVIATCNPSDEYDMQEMSKSLKSRFCVYPFEYEDSVDLLVLGKKEGKLLDFAKKVRLARINGQITTPLSTRDLVQFIGQRDGLGYALAKESMLAKFNNGEKAEIRVILETHLEESTLLQDKEKEVQ